MCLIVHSFIHQFIRPSVHPFVFPLCVHPSIQHRRYFWQQSVCFCSKYSKVHALSEISKHKQGRWGMLWHVMACYVTLCRYATCVVPCHENASHATFSVLNTCSTGWAPRSIRDSLWFALHPQQSDMQKVLPWILLRQKLCSAVISLYSSDVITLWWHSQNAFEISASLLQASPSVHGGKEQARQGGVQSAIVNVLEPLAMAQTIPTRCRNNRTDHWTWSKAQ